MYHFVQLSSPSLEIVRRSRYQGQYVQNLARVQQGPVSATNDAPVSKKFRVVPPVKVSLSWRQHTSALAMPPARNHTLNVIFPGISMSNRWTFRCVAIRSPTGCQHLQSPGRETDLGGCTLYMYCRGSRWPAHVLVSSLPQYQSVIRA